MEVSKDFQKMSLDDVVFEGRNKAYGSYFLRQIYGNKDRKSVV